MEDVVKSFLFVFATFLPIIDPFGGAMFFLSLTPGASDEIRAKITERMAIYSLIVLLVSLFAGRVILSFLESLFRFCRWAVVLCCCLQGGRRCMRRRWLKQKAMRVR